jgi:hypothetical protein
MNVRDNLYLWIGRQYHSHDLCSDILQRSGCDAIVNRQVIILLYSKAHASDDMDGLSEACNTHEEMRNSYKILLGKPEVT